MALVRQELAEFGKKIAAAGLTAGAGGNISAREGRLVWVKPSGFAMEELAGKDYGCVELKSGKRIEGKHPPTSELPMHLAIYQARPDIQAIFHTHSPWASGAFTSDADIRPMFAEVVGDLGGIKLLPYIMTSTQELADAVAGAARTCETIFMQNHGVVCLGKTMRQAFFRCCVAEDAAKAFLAAKALGTPRTLDDRQIAALKGLAAGAHRQAVMER